MPRDEISSRPLIDKLGVKPGARACVLGIDDPVFWQVLRGRTGDISTRARRDCDAIFYAADSVKELKRLESLRGNIVQNGAIWVVSRKGRAATLKDVDVIAAAISVGLVDNKVVAFSQTHTALRLVIPLALRR